MPPDRARWPLARRYPMPFTFSEHALEAMALREIRPAWVERTLAAPERRIRDPRHATVERFYCRIPENDGRVLRVPVNTATDPWRVVTVFFDRSMRGEL